MTEQRQYDSILLKMIKLRVTAQKILTNLINELQIPKELLAGKMGVSVFTIVRWQQGETNPTYAELKLLNQIYRGYNPKKKRGE